MKRLDFICFMILKELGLLQGLFALLGHNFGKLDVDYLALFLQLILADRLLLKLVTPRAFDCVVPVACESLGLLVELLFALGIFFAGLLLVVSLVQVTVDAVQVIFCYDENVA